MRFPFLLLIDVVDATSRANINYTLEGQLLAWYGDYANPKEPAAVIELQFVLVRETRATNPIVFNKLYSVRQPLPSDTTDDLIAGLDACLQRILTDFETDLVKTLAANPAPPQQ